MQVIKHSLHQWHLGNKLMHEQREPTLWGSEDKSLTEEWSLDWAI